MENKDKAISLFKYIMELYAYRYSVITDVKNQEWYKFITDIPQDDENIAFNYVDRAKEDEVDESPQVIILKVKKPEFEICPQPPETLENWLEYGWQRFDKKVDKKKLNDTNLNGKLQHEKFEDNTVRALDFDKWNAEREIWVKRQKKIDITRKFFNELHLKYIDLDRDSETIELMVGQGILECNIDEDNKVYHPVLLKRLSMEFDSKNNIISIIDNNIDPEIYTMLLQSIDFINHSAVKALNRQLYENYYHPLDRNDTPDYLKSFAHMLHSESRYAESSEDNLNMDDKLLIFNNPVFFIRKRTGGVIKALGEIIKQIEETGEVSGPLLNLIGENVSQYAEKQEILDFNENLAAINGEDKDILLSKEANKEQLEVAKRIELYNAVVVQGPPGTGKTHTIANLMGHFLAQGKSILVTSHTKKALSVVKYNVEKELQNLCVSVLEDNNKDMERSIDGITDYISTHTSLEIVEKAEKLKKKRLQIMSELSKVRNEIFAIKYKEYESIIFDGKGYSPAEAARFVYEFKETLSSVIQGKVTLYKPMPVSMGDLELLYKTNETIKKTDETELENELPNPIELISPDNFNNLIKNYNSLIERLNFIKENSVDDIKIAVNALCVSINSMNLCFNPIKTEIEKFKELITGTNTEMGKLEDWSLYAILDGKKGGGFKAVWEKLINIISDTYKYSSDTAELMIGKKIKSLIPINKNAIEIISKIKEHLSKGKKLSKLTFFMNKEWNDIYSSFQINEKSIETENDCDVLIAFIELTIKRGNMGILWEELISKHGGVSFKELDSEPEQICINYIKNIKQNVEWYNIDYKLIKEQAVKAGFNDELICSKQIYNKPLDEIYNIISLVYKIVPNYIEIVDIIYFTIPSMQYQIEKTIASINEKTLLNSTVCQNITNALKEMNTDKYKACYEELNELNIKYNYWSERFRILNALKSYAPDWANLIHNRIGIHGENHVPENTEDAWKWKQFAGIIEEITAQPFEELQHKSVALNAELHKITAELVENLAWLHLLHRIEGDIGKKQALQGWKETEKKIGKGTGKTAPALRRYAQILMAECQSVVPAWIMPINKALESLDPTKNKFDIVIIDEASQSDISALAIMYLAKKIIIVGDDEQVSPSAVGMDVDKMVNLADMYIKGVIPNSQLYDMKSSIYDIAKTTFPTLMLKEHFRCVPSIIGYSNRLSYDYKIKPLRDDSNIAVKPSTIAYRVDGTRLNKTNETEAKMIIALMLACMDQPEYKSMTFGVISLLGDEQAKKINALAISEINPNDYEKRRILCGNASHFQGDERDVIFISLVDSNEGDGPLRMTGDGAGKSTKQRYNVAVSRAKNQVWVIHSFDVNNDLQPGDMRRDLIEYVNNPKAFEEQEREIIIKADSPFEISVAKALTLNGYHIIQQWVVGSYKIDMVAVCKDKKIAIECDGELYHSGDDKIREDMERQSILERLGWRFIRIRSSEYYRNPITTINRVITELNEYEIEPENNASFVIAEDNNLVARVIIKATNILKKWEESNLAEEDLINNGNGKFKQIVLK